MILVKTYLPPQQLKVNLIKEYSLMQGNLKSYFYGAANICHKSIYKATSTYSGTVQLPKTSFPQRVEGSKRVELDQSIVNSAQFQNFYRRHKAGHIVHIKGNNLSLYIL